MKVGARAKRMIAAICRGAKLTQEKEDELAVKARSGDSEAANELAMHTMRHAVVWAAAFAGRGVDFEDLVGEATLATLEASRVYEPQGKRFATFANFRIANAIRQALSRQAGAVSFKGAAGKIAIPGCGLDAPSEVMIGKSISDSLIADSIPPDDKLSAREMVELVDAAVTELTKRREMIVRRRWLEEPEGDDWQLRNIGDEIGTSHEYVRLEERRAFAEIRKKHGAVLKSLLED